MLGQHVDNTDFTNAFCKSTNAVTVGVIPPGFAECSFPVGIGVGWGYVQVSASGAKELLCSCAWVNKSLGLFTQIY